MLGGNCAASCRACCSVRPIVGFLLWKSNSEKPYQSEISYPVVSVHIYPYDLTAFSCRQKQLTVLVFFKPARGFSRSCKGENQLHDRISYLDAQIPQAVQKTL